MLNAEKLYNLVNKDRITLQEVQMQCTTINRHFSDYQVKGVKVEGDCVHYSVDGFVRKINLLTGLDELVDSEGKTRIEYSNYTREKYLESKKPKEEVEEASKEPVQFSEWAKSAPLTQEELDKKKEIRDKIISKKRDKEKLLDKTDRMF